MEDAAALIFAEMFPYLRWSAILDVRTPRQHKQLETLGIHGTPIYFRADPVLKRWFIAVRRWHKLGRSPCRCAWVDYSAERAAELYGISSPSLVEPFPFDPWDSRLLEKCRNS